MQEDNSKHSIFQLKSAHHWFSDVIIQLSSNSICAIKSTILPEIKCPQLSKPKPTVVKNQNSICDRSTYIYFRHETLDVPPDRSFSTQSRHGTSWLAFADCAANEIANLLLPQHR